MTPPMVCFVTWNRAGVTARNLTDLLNTTDDFELFIIDNNSQDDTWEYIQSLKDDRIKCKKRFDLNRGLVYAVNYALSKRKKDQYFIIVENDVCIKTKNWVTQFMKAMDTFTEVGIMSAVYWVVAGREKPEKIIKKGDLTYYQDNIAYLHCSCWRPELFEYIGYFSEDILSYDLDIWTRVKRFTPFKFGYINTIQLDQQQNVSCGECLLKKQCSIQQKSKNCYDIYRSKHRHLEFAKFSEKKRAKFWDEMSSGKRSIYCASIHDPDSMHGHVYNKEWAEENFQFFIDNSN